MTTNAFNLRHSLWPSGLQQQQQFIQLSNNLRLCHPQLVELF